MANNRLYMVDTDANEYLLIAKGWGCEWISWNLDAYDKFLATRFGEGGDKTNLILGTEHDREFCKKWIVNGKNFIHEYLEYKKMESTNKIVKTAYSAT